MLESRKCNIIHTRLRHQCSSLGADLFRANITNDPSCPFGFPLEDAIHYLWECPLYTNARMQLFMNITPLWKRFELTTLVVIGTDYTGTKLPLITQVPTTTDYTGTNYHWLHRYQLPNMITTTTTAPCIREDALFHKGGGLLPIWYRSVIRRGVPTLLYKHSILLVLPSHVSRICSV